MAIHRRLNKADLTHRTSGNDGTPLPTRCIAGRKNAFMWSNHRTGEISYSRESFSTYLPRFLELGPLGFDFLEDLW
jgi:hypothetical protein